MGAVLVFRDITERRRADAREKLTEHRLSQLAKSGVIGVLFGDINGNIIDANDELLRIIGRTRGDLNTGLTWTGISPPEFQSATDNALEEALERGACTPYEKEYIRPDGSRVPVLIGYVLLEPEREKSVAFVADLSARKEAEAALRRLNDDLQTFTDGATHDLKEPLRMVGSYMQLLSKRYAGQLDADGEDYIRYALDGVTRMQALVDSLIEFSQAGSVTPVYSHAVDPGRALEYSLSSLRAAISESSAEITHDSLPPVLIHETHLTQIFQNLIGNAIKYHGSEPPRVHVSGNSVGEVCEFCVSDNGIGIPARFHERIFGAFQRLHGRERSGTGLGLATTKRLIERYGGRIRVESEGDGRGSKFCFTLRLAVTQHTGSASRS